MAGDLLGVDVSRTGPALEFNLGTIADQSVGEFIYAQYLLLTDKGEVAILSADNQAQPMTLDGASMMFGARIGVCVSDANANDYGWVQVRGDVQFQSDADATANTQMYATDVAGQIGITEEDGGALASIVLTEAAGVMAGLASGRLLNPTAGAATGSGGGGGGSVEPKRRELLARTEIDEDTYVSVTFAETPSEGSTIVFEGYLNATATNPRGVVVLPAASFLKLAHPDGGADQLG